MPDPVLIEVFYCAPGVGNIDATANNVWCFKRLERPGASLVAPHNEMR